MITFILLAVFAMIAGFFALIAYTANNRKRAGMKGNNPVDAKRTLHR
jgi:hypothetical protein